MKNCFCSNGGCNLCSFNSKLIVFQLWSYSIFHRWETCYFNLLCILSIPGLLIGCIVTNIISPLGIMDMLSIPYSTYSHNFNLYSTCCMGWICLLLWNLIVSYLCYWKEPNYEEFSNNYKKATEVCFFDLIFIILHILY